MEINTRLQVEHPVTEMVTGLDLVEWQLRVAAGEQLPLAQEDIAQHGHAIEVRLYAEDPGAEFPARLGPPGSPACCRRRRRNVRLDGGVVEGDAVTIFYDPMIAKLIVWDEDRPRALARLRDALAGCEIAGPKSNVEFLEKLIRHPVVVEGRIDTGYLDKHLDEVLPDPQPPSSEDIAAAAAACLLHDEAATRAAALGSADPYSPWAFADGWRLGHAGQRVLCFGWRERRIDIVAHGSAGHYLIEQDCQPRGRDRRAPGR